MAVTALPPPDVDTLLSPVRRVLATLMRSNALSAGDQAEALSQLTEVATRVLKVARASVWLLDDAHSRIDCIDLYETKTASHTRGAVIPSLGAPRYFDALKEARTIAASDAMRDPRTQEFAAEYLPTHGITSMLDAPVLVRGKLAGLVCFEHIGPQRRWEFWEELVAGSLADFAAMVLGATEYLNQAAELTTYRTRLEALVELKTRALVGAEHSFRLAFEAAPIALLITRASDAALVTANPRAVELFEMPADNLDHVRGTDLWVDANDGIKAMATLHEKGRVDGLEAQLRTTKGHVFWAQFNLRDISHGNEPCIIAGVRDITAQRNAEAALKRSRDELRLLFDAAPSPLLLLRSSDGVILECNEQAETLLARPRDVLLGKRVPELFVEASARATFRALLAEHDRVEGFEAQLKADAGQVRWGLFNARQLVVDGEARVFLGVTEVSDQKRLEATLREQASTDGLTGAVNRRRFNEVFAAEHSRAERTGREFTVALLDLDHFKRLNDTYGHAVGDDALKLARSTAQACIRRVDVLARYGGEEFVFVLPETPLATGLQVMGRVRQALSEQTITTANGAVRFTVSIGVAAWRKGEPADALLARADRALYAAKHAGRNTVRAEEQLNQNETAIESF